MCVATAFDMTLFAGGICNNLGNSASPPDDGLLRFLIAWGRAEGGGTDNGGWTQSNSCTYNMFNMAGWTTNLPKGVTGQCNVLSSKSGATFGVLCFDSLFDAVTANSNLIAASYPSLAAAIKADNPAPFAMPSGTVAQIDPGVSADLQTWVSGSPTGYPKYVANILSIAQSMSSAVVGNTTPGTPVSTATSSIDWYRIARGALGAIILLTGLSLFIKSMTPPQVGSAIGKAVKTLAM